MGFTFGGLEHDYDVWRTTPPDEPESKFRCTCCGEEMFPDDDYYDIEGEHFCKDCAEEWFEEQRHKVTEGQCYGE